MSNEQRRFIIKPLFNNFNTTNLNYRDVLTFVTIKSFDNHQHECFPSQETIATLSGLSKSFIIESVERLEQNKALSIYRSGRYTAQNRSEVNKYFFPHITVYNQIPYQIFEADDLKPCEKAMLLLLRQFQSCGNEIYGSINEYSDMLGLTYNAIYKQYKSLVSKGYLDNTLIKQKRTKLLKIDWSFPEYLKVNKK